jgi:hypothetical protein
VQRHIFDQATESFQFFGKQRIKGIGEFMVGLDEPGVIPPVQVPNSARSDRLRCGNASPLFLDDLHGFFGLSKQDYSDLFIYCEVGEPNGGWHYPNQIEWIAQAKALV